MEFGASRDLKCSFNFTFEANGKSVLILADYLLIYCLTFPFTKTFANRQTHVNQLLLQVY